MQNLFERSLGTYTLVRFAILQFYSDRLGVYDSKKMRVFFKEINALGALNPLSLMTGEEAYDFLLNVEKVYYPDLKMNNSAKANIELIVEENHSKDEPEFEAADDHLNHHKGPLYYIKKITRQDVLRTFVLNKEAVNLFFNLELLQRDDAVSVRVRYGPEGPILTARIVLKQDVRIYISRGGLEMGDIIVFKRVGISFYEIKFFKKSYKRFKKLNLILNNQGYAIEYDGNF
jgi:hypothetical protein